MNGDDFPNWKVIAARLHSPLLLTDSTLGLVSCKLSHLPGWIGWDVCVCGGGLTIILLYFFIGLVSQFPPGLTLSGLVTVMVSMVTCGAPILATAGNLKQEKYHQLLLQRHSLPKT